MPTPLCSPGWGLVDGVLPSSPSQFQLVLCGVPFATWRLVPFRCLAACPRQLSIAFDLVAGTVEEVWYGDDASRWFVSCSTVRTDPDGNRWNLHRLETAVHQTRTLWVGVLI